MNFHEEMTELAAKAKLKLHSTATNCRTFSQQLAAAIAQDLSWPASAWGWMDGGQPMRSDHAFGSNSVGFIDSLGFHMDLYFSGPDEVETHAHFTVEPDGSQAGYFVVTSSTKGHAVALNRPDTRAELVDELKALIRGKVKSSFPTGFA